MRRRVTTALLLVTAWATLIAAGFELYPGATEPDWADRIREQAARQGGVETDAGLRGVQIYATNDSFDKVYAFYKKTATEVQGMSSPKPRRGPKGMMIHVGAFTFDGAPTLRESKECVVITRPVFLDVNLQEMRDVTAIELLKKK